LYFRCANPQDGQRPEHKDFRKHSKRQQARMHYASSHTAQCARSAEDKHRFHASQFTHCSLARHEAPAEWGILVEPTHPGPELIYGMVAAHGSHKPGGSRVCSGAARSDPINLVQHSHELLELVVLVVDGLDRYLVDEAHAALLIVDEGCARRLAALH